MENKNDKIWQYVENGKLQMEKVIEIYSNYVCKIIRNSYLKISNEDLEEITLDVFLTLWKNQNKLDLNKSMSSYIAGITKNLIKKKYRDIKLNYNIEDYDEQIIETNPCLCRYLAAFHAGCRQTFFRSQGSTGDYRQGKHLLANA